MNVYMSIDIEGVAGIVAWEQTELDGGAEYELGKRLMTEETNAAIEGALAAGATEIVVNDAHDKMRNINPELLHPAARLIQGTGKPMSMVEGLDASCDAVFLIGYHAPEGVRDGTLNHVYYTRGVSYNGVRCSEATINASIAGYYGVPTVLVTGDEAAIRDSEAVLPPHVGVAVKRGITRYAADSLHPTLARERIRDGARRALAGLSAARPFTFDGPITVDVELSDSHQADRVAMIPTVERVDDRAVRYVAPDVLAAFRIYSVIAMLLGA
jgi:D-amino peptidase